MYLSGLTLLLLACTPEGSDAGAKDSSDGTACVAATEVCNDVDDDCDGEVDEDAADATPWYADTDGDGFGAEPVGSACTAPAAASSRGDDCDDTDPSIHPDATETCTPADGTPADEDCDGLVDDADSAAEGQQEWCPDADGDGYGAGEVIVACEAPAGHGVEGDCDDADASVRPGAPEVCADGIDQDCDGEDPACARWAGEVDPAGSASVTVDGRGGAFGSGPVTLDYDGDGDLDVVVGDRLATTGGAADQGEVYVIPAPVTGGPVEEVASLLLQRHDGTSQIGAVVQPAGDVDRDGVDDVYLYGLGVLPGGLAGTVWNDEVPALTLGCTAVAPLGDAGHGLYDGLVCALDDSAQLVYSAYDPEFLGMTGDLVGGTVGSLDIGGDGLLDAVVTAPAMERGGAAYAGRVAGFEAPFGSANESVYYPDLAIDGDETRAWVGEGWIASGDYDGDGADDLAVPAAVDGDHGATGGVVYVFLDPAVGEQTTADADVVLVGYASGLSSADVDGDGAPDLLLTLPVAGACALFYGPLSGVYDLTVDADATFRGESNREPPTCGVLPDDDGAADLLVASPSGQGTLYLLEGR